MIEEVALRLSPRQAADRNFIIDEASAALGIDPRSVNDLLIIRKSIDSRKRDIQINLTVRVAYGEDRSAIVKYEKEVFEPLPSDAPQAVVVGAGPAGLFAALQLIRRGIRPVVIERGKDVDSRRLDIAALNRTGEVNPDSNYCFGEGGAGTFSDGKLYTRSKKRGENEAIMRLLVDHGASEDILSDSHPHIGSDRLPGIIKSIRENIIRCGGEVRFNTKMERLLISGDPEFREVTGIVTSTGEKIQGPVILATGHSSRDTYRALDAAGVELETKGFAMGVRLEHPSALIDSIQYHSPDGRGEYLPAAEYNFVTQVEGRGVYSFCMCPGGVVVPAVSGPGQSVVNGMSASARSGRWSNSGMVVEIRPEDFPEYDSYGVFKLMVLQEDLERRFSESVGNSLQAPAQRMTDFVKSQDSRDLPKSSYVPGLRSLRLDKLLPPHISRRLQKGLKEFGHKAKGFLSNEAVLIGLESRTSSPVRIPRDRDKLSHVHIRGLYPAGEGAGYAGGIISAAVDGRRCADALADTYIHS